MIKRILITVVAFFVICPFGSAEKNTHSNIVIIGAMDCEIQRILDAMCGCRIFKLDNFEYKKGKINKCKVVVLKSGVGKSNSAMTTQFAIDKFKPDLIINTGLAGALNKTLKKGDIVFANKLIQHDFDNSALGYAKGYMSTGLNPNKPTEYLADKIISEEFKNKMREVIENSLDKRVNKINEVPKIYTGLIISGDSFIASENKKQQIKDEFSAMAVDMESASVALVANKNNVPVVVIRTISDGFSEKTKEYVEHDELFYAELSAQVLTEVLKKLK